MQIHWRATDTLQIVCMCAVCRCLPCVCCVTLSRNSYSKVIRSHIGLLAVSLVAAASYVYALCILEIKS